MATKLTHEQKGILDDQLLALRDKTVNGVRDFNEVRKALQDIIEGKSVRGGKVMGSIPSWFVPAKRQLERARELWPNAVLPELPKRLSLLRETEVLLLHVPDSFDALWDKVVAPNSYSKWRWEGVKTGESNLRLVPNRTEFTAPTWVAFDPEHGKNDIPASFWSRDDVTLAASEVLSALIQFPEWPLAWYESASVPNLAGYQLKQDNWSYAPYLDLYVPDRQLKLSAHWAHRPTGCWASPTVRKIS